MPALPTIANRPPALRAASPRVSAADVIHERIPSALLAAAIALTATISTPALAAEGEVPPLPTPSTSFASTPFTDLSDSIDYGLTRDGRIRPCPGAIPNCVSTSSTTDLYAPALRAEATTPAKAAELLDTAVASSLKGEKIFEGTASRGEGLEGIFLQYEVPGASGRVRGPAGQPTKDVIEVLLRPEKTTRKEENGEEEENLDTIVTYRSVADPESIRFLPLLQQPLTDGGAQKTRMRGLLAEKLGWRAIGCDTLDCFME